MSLAGWYEIYHHAGYLRDAKTMHEMIIMLNAAKNILLCMIWCAILLAVFHGKVFSESINPEDIDWHLVEMGGTEVMLLLDGKRPSMLLDAQQRKVTGFSGCNHYFGNYELDGATLKFGLLGATRKACPDKESVIEQNFFEMLANTRKWRITEGMLLLIDGDDVLGRFYVKQSEVPAANPESMIFHSKVLQASPVILTHGVYRASVAADSASEDVVRLTDMRAYGMLGDKSVGAIVVVTTLGGSGTFYELALLIGNTQGWVNTDTVLIGVRAKVHAVAIEGGYVVVTMTAHGPQDPMCCPTVEVMKRFTLQNDRLVEVNDKIFEMQSQLFGTVWQWAHTRYNNDTQTVPAKPANYTVQFLDEGRLTVKADCIQKGGAYRLVDQQLSLMITHSTMAACEEGSVEDQFVRDLRGGSGFFLSRR